MAKIVSKIKTDEFSIKELDLDNKTLTIIGLIQGTPIEPDWTIFPTGEEIKITNQRGHAEWDAVRCDFVFSHESEQS